MVARTLSDGDISLANYLPGLKPAYLLQYDFPRPIGEYGGLLTNRLIVLVGEGQIFTSYPDHPTPPVPDGTSE
jgi:hypothetical protein